MGVYWRFLGMGLVLGLATEIQLKLNAGLNPRGLLIAVVVYPFLITLSFLASKVLDRFINADKRADLIHYLAAGCFGLAFEWILLGNGPDSNASQLGMFAMWTTFCFGPRVLSRKTAEATKVRRLFWVFFALFMGAIGLLGMALPHPEVRFVVIIVATIVAYVFLSFWLLVIVWRDGKKGRGPT